MTAEVDDRRLLADPSRQAPLAVVFIVLSFFRNLGVVNFGFAVFFVLSGGLSGRLWLAAVVAVFVLLVATILRWWKFTFAVTGGDLVVTKGILSTDRLVIPLDRVQSVGIEQKLLHRVVDLVEASVETAGSQEVEFTIDAIPRASAEALQRLAGGAAPEPVAAVDPFASPPGAQYPVPSAERTVVSRTLRDLVRIGATKFPLTGLVLLGPVFVFGDEVVGLLGIDIDIDFDRADRATADAFDGVHPVVVAAFVVALLLVVAAVGVALQVLREIFANWNLTVVRTATGLRRTAGLLSRSSTASTLGRVQTISSVQSPAQRWIGIRRIELAVVGHGDIDIPGTTGTELETFRTMVFGTDERPVRDRMIASAFIFLAVRNAALVVVAVVVLAAFSVGWWAALGVAVIPIRWAVARRQWRLRRWGLVDGRLAESSRLVIERTTELEMVKAQTVTVTRSFFERRRGLATLRVVTAEGAFEVPLIAHDDARSVRDVVLHDVEHRPRPFM